MNSHHQWIVWRNDFICLNRAIFVGFLDQFSYRFMLTLQKLGNIFVLFYNKCNEISYRSRHGKHSISKTINLHFPTSFFIRAIFHAFQNPDAVTNEYSNLISRNRLFYSSKKELPSFLTLLNVQIVSFHFILQFRMMNLYFLL